MGTWGVGVFDNDDALDFVADNMDEMYKVIEEFFAGEDPDIIEEGEGLIMPRIKLMAMMARIGREAEDPIIRCAPPEKETINAWKEAYLAGFDDQIEDLEPEEEYLEARREEIANTFDELLNEADLLEALIEEAKEKETQEEDQFLMLAQLVDDDSEIVLRCAEIFLGRQMWSEAIQKFEQALELGVEDFSESFALNNLAWAYAQLKDYDKAIELAEKSLESETQFPHFYSTLGYIYYATGRDEEALEQYNKALETHDSSNEESLYDPTLAETHWWRAKVHDRLGDAGSRDKDLDMIKALGCKPPTEELN